MSDTITTLLVGGTEDDAAAIERADGGIEVVAVTDGPPETITDSAEAGDSPAVDCVVDASDGADQPVRTPVPVVAWTDADPTDASEYAAYVGRNGNPGAVADGIRWALARSDDGDSTPPSEHGDGTPPSEHGDGTPPSVDADRVIEALVDGVVVVDAADRLAHLNRAAQVAVDPPEGGLVGEHVSVLGEAAHLGPDAVERFEVAIEELRDDGGVRILEMRMDPPEVDARTVELRGTSLEGDWIVATVRDVTRREQTERALRHSRERIARLHEAAASVVACRSEAELFEEAIDAAERVLEFDVSSIIVFEDGWLVPKALSSGANSDGVRRMRPGEGLAGKTFKEGEPYLVVDAQDNDEAAPASDAYRSGISVPVGEHGVFQAVAGTPAAFDEDDLELADLLMSHVGEALTRIRAEQHLRERERDLRTERDRLAALFENIPDPCVAFDFEDGKPIVRDVNRAFEEVFGYDTEELVGEDIDEYVIPEGYDEEATDMNETLQAGERLRTASKRLTADGVRDFFIHVVPFKVGERTVQGYGIYSDITEQKERERELRRQNDRLDEFASMVSHDLRNPLTVAQGYLEVAREDGDPGVFDEIATAHDRMARMIDELLALSRRGDVVDEVQSVAITETVDRAWANVDTADASLAVESEGTVEADPGRLSELFENLFRNSVEHGSTSSRPEADDAVEHAGTDAAVRVGRLTEEDGTAGGFFVADDGPGIPADERDRVFESGYTTRDRGTGFGLHIVAEIAEAHGWTVELTDSEAGGARFEFVTDGAGDGEGAGNDESAGDGGSTGTADDPTAPGRD